MECEKMLVIARVDKDVTKLIDELYDICIENGSYSGTLEEYYGAYIKNELKTIIELQKQMERV